MTNKLDGIIEANGTKQKERGFNCMQLISFLTSDGVKEFVPMLKSARYARKM